MGEKTNGQRMEEYKLKADVLGLNQFNFEYYEAKDYVMVMDMRVDSNGDIKIPKFVSSISQFAWNEKCNEATIYIPKNCIIDFPESIDIMGISDYTKHIEVDAEHKKYISIDGVLFSKDKTQLLAYPKYKEDAEYKIPSSVYSVGDYAFVYNHFLNKVSISRKLVHIGQNMFNRKTRFAVDRENEMYKSLRSSLYSKDGKTLYYMYGEQYKDIKVEEGTVLIKKQFDEGDYGKLYFPQSLKYIEEPDMLFDKYTVWFDEIMAPKEIKKQLKEYEKDFKITYY